MSKQIIVIGAGLSGCEVSFQLANLGHKIKLFEMKPKNKSPAHILDTFAELVCSNSFRSGNIQNSAVGLMHQELRELNSLIIGKADQNRVPAGDALAVDRIEFSKSVTEEIQKHPNIEIIYEEFYGLKEVSKDNIVIIATGPLTSEKLNKEILELVGGDSFNFFDAIAPIIHKDSIDFSKAWFQSRYDRGTKDYINCALTEDEYDDFYNAIISSEEINFEDWEKDIPYFEGCLPIEIMAKRGKQTLLFGPMKPVGLLNPMTNKQPFAVIQLRQENNYGTLFNMVGFQTKLKYSDQKRIFRMIPALKNAEFAKLGSIHKNTFINSPELLNNNLSLKKNSNIFFAGQITGCEGYVESVSIGLLCALFVHHHLQNIEIKVPTVSAMGAILSHIINKYEGNKQYQPSNINFGLFPEQKEKNNKKMKKAEKKQFIIQESLNNIRKFKEILK